MKPGRRWRSLIAAAATSVLTLWAHPALAHTVYIVSEANRLARFDTSNPGAITDIGAITGLLGAEQILAIDMRAVDGRLYGISDLHLYKINQVTGLATAVSNTPFPAPLAGAVSIDFDPVSGLLRVITSTGQNLTVQPDSGVVTGAAPIGAPAAIVGAAYLAPIGSAPSTLKAIDATGDRLLTVAPDTGTWAEIGPLGFDTGDSAALDYSIDGKGWAVMAAAADLTSTFFTIAENGTATPAGTIGARVRALAVISRAWRLYGLTNSNTIVTVTSNLASQPGPLAEVPILNLPEGENVLAIDTWPATGEVFGITSAGHLITINPKTGAVVFKGTLNEALDGTPVGFDIDPVTNRARVTTDTGQNLSVLVTNATVIPETDLSSTGIVGLAYTPAVGALTTLYGIDASSDQLVTFANPANGVSTPVLPLGVNVEAGPFAAMDFAADGTLFATIANNAATSSDLYIISPADGTVLKYLTIGAPKFRGLAVAPIGSVRVDQFLYNVLEDSGKALVTVERNHGSDGPAYVTLTLSDGTATAPGDYQPLETVVELRDGEIGKTVKVIINADGTVEPDETIPINLKDPQFGVRLGSPSTGTIIIKNDDPVLGTARPTIEITSPTNADSVTWTGPLVTLAGTASDDTTVSSVTWQNARAGGMTPATLVGGPAASVSWEAHAIPLFEGINPITMRATDNLGNVSTDTIVLFLGELSYYLAEGATGTFFDLDLLLANPTDSLVAVRAKFLKPLGQGTVEQVYQLLPRSRRTVRVDEIDGLENAEVSTIVTAPVSTPIVVERTMTWDSTGYGAHTDKAAGGPAQKWYFAEGSQGFFFTYLLLANPQAAANSATVRYLRQGMTPVTRTYPLVQLERRTIDLGADADLVNTSFGIEVTFDQPGIAERAMYFGLNPLWLGGHESMGETEPSRAWFLAEGATGPFFETFVLIANPSATDATVEVEFLPSSGSPVTKTYTVEAGTRETINIEAEDVSLANEAVATSLTSDVPIVVERAQYWPDPAPSWYEAHNSFGVTNPGTRWGLAEGRVGGTNSYETYILLANPGDLDARVGISFLREDGSIVQKDFEVRAKSRFNVQVTLEAPELVNESFGALVGSTVPIVVERAMYSNAGGQVWQAGTNATATRLPNP